MNHKLVSKALTVVTFILLAIFFITHEDHPKKLEKIYPMIITGKTFRDFGGNNLRPGLCRFFYQKGETGFSIHEFEDSCRFYHIGDTIK